MLERPGYEHSGGASGTGRSSTHLTHHATYHHDMTSRHITTAPSDRNRDHMKSDTDRMRSGDQTRDHDNSGPTNQDRSENDRGYQHTTYERPGTYGHAKGLPPSQSHAPKSGTNPPGNPDDEDNGPSD